MTGETAERRRTRADRERELILDLPDRVVREIEVTAMIGRPRSSLNTMVDKGQFPKPFKIGERAKGWMLSKVQAWLAERQAAAGDSQ